MRTTLTPFAPDNQRAADTCPLSLKWCFQLLLELGGHRNLLGQHGFNDDDLEMGLGRWVETDDCSAADVLKGLRQGARKLQADHPQVSHPTAWEESRRAGDTAQVERG